MKWCHGLNSLTEQLWAVMTAHFSTSFFGDWRLQRFFSVVSHPTKPWRWRGKRLHHGGDVCVLAFS